MRASRDSDALEQRLATKGVFGGLVFFAAAIGYSVGGGFILSAFLKIFLPGNTGLWMNGSRLAESGTLFPAPGPPAREVLGYWFIPLALTIGALLLIATTWAIRLCLRTARFCQARLGVPRSRVAAPVATLALVAMFGARSAWPRAALAADPSVLLTVAGQQAHLARHLANRNGALQGERMRDGRTSRPRRDSPAGMSTAPKFAPRMKQK